MDETPATDSDERGELLHAAVDAALDELLGPQPTGLVEERPETVDPTAENEAQAHLWRSPARFHGFG